LGSLALVSFEHSSGISAANPLGKTPVLDQADLPTLIDHLIFAVAS
jgi:hypothetical protein